MYNLRPDIAQFIGGAGFVYNTLQEAVNILRQPYPEELRQLGFEQAKKSDIFVHKNIVTDLWDKAG